MRPPRKFTPDQRHEIWERIGAGESPASIARSMDRYPSAVRSLMLATGGIAPPARTRSPRCLSIEEREEISRGLCAGASLRTIARHLGRAPSSISREVARNGGSSHYRAQSADRRAYRCARRPKAGKLSRCPRLRDLVAAKLERKWSPEQIARWLRATFPENPELHVSHETIYLALYVQGRGELRRELQRSLRSGRTLRRAKTRLPTGVGQLPDMVMISERPPEVEDRAVPGHWEGDLIMGSKNSCIGTLVERSTRYVMLLKLERPSAEEVRRAMAKKITVLPEELRRSVTWDQGGEMAQHRRFSVDTGVQVYFCDPRSPWQRGSNENTNGLLRQYFPKGTDLSRFTSADLNDVARELNERPRKTLGWVAPLDRLAELLR